MRKFKINPDIVYDTIGGEVILLDIEKGNYYQLKNEAVQVWDELMNRKISSATMVADSLSKSGAYSSNEILESIIPFIDELESEHILLEIKESNENTSLSRVKGKVKRKFPTPVLLKYTDMQSILLLDPIHDTYDKGWPNKKRKNP
ncbi:MAG: PqqD family protein [Candidatus Levybacteria bacterium]|nr:PqqD family protein [Candidatus Levybacteria bacterium]